VGYKILFFSLPDCGVGRGGVFFTTLCLARKTPP
jgi:hypothetical protein